MKFISINTKEIITKTPSRLDDVFNLGVFFNSTESRASFFGSILKEKSLDFAIIVDFRGGENEVKECRLKENCEHLSVVSREYRVLRLDNIFNFYFNLNEIVKSIKPSCYGLTPKFFLDMTGAPLIYSSAIVKFFLRSFPRPEVWAMNVSGIYKDRGEQQFAEGVRDDIFIPGYYGEPDYSLPVRYVFLLGYEGERSLKIYRDNLPEYVSIVIPDPGYESGNACNTIQNNREFLKETGVVMGNGDLLLDESVYRIPVWDVKGVYSTVCDIYQKSKGKELLRLAPLGPKPHALGAALAGVLYNDISIMYQVPQRYFLSEIEAGDRCWVYQITAE